MAAMNRRRTALLQNLAAILTWSLAPTMIHGIIESFPVNFQNACRYLVSLIVLWPVVLLPAGRERRGLYARILRAKAGKLLLIALANYAFQTCYTYSLSLVMPSVMSLVSQTQVLFGVLFAVLFFSDERAFMGRPLFIIGMLLAVGGVALVIGGGSDFGTPAFGVGVLLVVGSAFSWALLGALLRAWLPEAPPLLSISAVFTIVTPLFLATYAATHAGFPIPRAPALHWLIMVSSGLLAVGLGQSLFYRAVPVLGISVSSSIGLLTPMLASLLSYIVYGERLTAVQLAGAAVLICGSWLVVRARFRSADGPRTGARRAPEAAPPAPQRFTNA
jgi:drug/metabolite transporter (DMT)-like permease